MKTEEEIEVDKMWAEVQAKRAEQEAERRAREAERSRQLVLCCLDEMEYEERRQRRYGARMVVSDLPYSIEELREIGAKELRKKAEREEVIRRKKEIQAEIAQRERAEKEKAYKEGRMTKEEKEKWEKELRLAEQMKNWLAHVYYSPENIRKRLSALPRTREECVERVRRRRWYEAQKRAEAERRERKRYLITHPIESLLKVVVKAIRTKARDFEKATRPE